jgi:hypothetical protein
LRASLQKAPIPGRGLHRTASARRVSADNNLGHQVNKGSVKDLVARLETAQAKEEAVSGAMQRRPQAMAKLRNDLKQEDALLREHRLYRAPRHP